jgi:hypothetical protein
MKPAQESAKSIERRRPQRAGRPAHARSRRMAPEPNVNDHMAEINPNRPVRATPRGRGRTGLASSSGAPRQEGGGRPPRLREVRLLRGVDSSTSTRWWRAASPVRRSRFGAAVAEKPEGPFEEARGSRSSTWPIPTVRQTIHGETSTRRSSSTTAGPTCTGEMGSCTGSTLEPPRRLGRHKNTKILAPHGASAVPSFRQGGGIPCHPRVGAPCPFSPAPACTRPWSSFAP